MRSLILSLLPAVAFAQSASSDSTRLAPVVITATRVETVIAAPAAVTVLSGDTLRARGITHLADALRLVPGATVVSSSSLGSQASLFLRGGQSNFVRVLLDGVPLNEPGGALDIGALTLDNIDRVEVVRGPASVLYGADAVSGVIQLVSRTAARGTRGALAIEAGSYGQRDLVLSGGAGFRRASVSASVADRAADGMLAYNNAYRNRVANASLRVLPDARTEATLSVRWQAATYQVPTGSSGALEDHNAENTSRRLVVAFTGRRIVAKGLAASWNLSSGEHNPRNNDGPDDAADTLGFFGYYSRGTVTRRAADLRLTARAGDTHSVTVGAEAARDHERSSNLSLSQYGTFPGAFVAARNDRSLYLQAVGAVAGSGSYQLGARLDDNSAFGTFRTVRLGASWALAGPWRARAAVGSAFRAPTFYENFASGYVLGNAALVPEQSRSREIGLDGAAHGVAFSLTAYQQRFRDLIQYTSAPAVPNGSNYHNIAGANADGLEANLGFVLPGALRTNVTYAFARTRVTDAGYDTAPGANLVLGQRLIRRPAHAARVEFVRSLGTRAGVTAGAAYTGKADDRNFGVYPAEPVVLPARTLVDLASLVRLSASGARVPLSARVRIDNLTGVRYQGIYGFRAPGRAVRLGLTLGNP
ncbi:MAG: TonB-dependent receptor [Gemmatimonadota bacterium]